MAIIWIGDEDPNEVKELDDKTYRRYQRELKNIDIDFFNAPIGPERQKVGQRKTWLRLRLISADKARDLKYRTKS